MKVECAIVQRREWRRRKSHNSKIISSGGRAIWIWLEKKNLLGSKLKCDMVSEGRVIKVASSLTRCEIIHTTDSRGAHYGIVIGSLGADSCILQTNGDCTFRVVTVHFEGCCKSVHFEWWLYTHTHSFLHPAPTYAAAVVNGACTDKGRMGCQSQVRNKRVLRDHNTNWGIQTRDKHERQTCSQWEKIVCVGSLQNSLTDLVSKGRIKKKQQM